MRTLIAMLSVLLLAACGGGGDSGGPSISPAPEQVLLGVDQGSQVERLDGAGERGEIEIRYGVVRDGAGREAVAGYLNDAWPDSRGGRVSRFTQAPTLRVIGAATARERITVMAAVDAINLALPLEARIRVAAADPGTTLRDTIGDDGRYYGGRGHPNEINVEFLDCDAYVKCGSGAGATTWAFGGIGEPRQGYIQVLRGTEAERDDRHARTLVAHELLHAMGIWHHVGNFNSIMRARDHYFYATDQILTGLDREALRALYERLEPGDAPTAFGPWSDASVHLVGEGRYASFGVALRNGYVEPWISGALPRRDLHSNDALAGVVRWDGALVGFSAGRPVAGDALIAVDLAALIGTAAFTGLENWEPHQVGDGAEMMWGDGDLSYDIAVTGNTFRETGGDAGQVRGIFTGRDHEGAAGTLERFDLTAAFGAER